MNNHHHIKSGEIIKAEGAEKTKQLKVGMVTDSLKIMKRQYFAITLIGLDSICSQIILIRELIAVFSGNELTMGFVLASWFLWVALGSTTGGKWKGKNSNTLRNRFALLQILLPFVLISQVILIRESRRIFSLPQMAIVGLGPIFWVSFLLLAPLCFMLGVMFSTGYQWLSIPQVSPATRVGWVYMLEAIGAGVGGGLFSFLLILILSHIQICFLLGMINLLSAFLLYLKEQGGNCAGTWISGALFVLFGVLFLSSPYLDLDMKIYSFQWRDFILLDCTDSIYGRIALTSLDGEYNFYEHGVLTGTLPDPWTSEWKVHLPLLQHQNPESLLLIGTGLGSIQEALKHKSLYLIDYIELDPTALLFAQIHCPLEYTKPLQDPRVNPIHSDARLHLRKSKRIYDAIILGLPDPKTAQINRMYTKEFFDLAARHLSGKGIIALSVTSSENYIGPQLAEFLTCIHKTLQSVFPGIVVTPGDTAYFIAGKQKESLTLNPSKLALELINRGIKTSYFSKYYLPAELSQERINSLNMVFDSTADVWINKDLRPVCYFYDLILWGRYFSPSAGKILEKAKGLNRRVIPFFFILLIIILAIAIRPLGSERYHTCIIGLIVLMGGFIEIVLEFLIILSFQIFYGYAYLQLGILITGFMVGLGIGSALMSSILEGLKKPYQWLIAIQTAYLLYPLLLLSIFQKFTIALWQPKSVEYLFLTLISLAGFIGGFQFPLATKLFIAKTQKWKGKAGLLYGLDLIGSGAGAILASSFLIPLYGIRSTFGILAFMGAIGLILLVVGKK